MRLWLSSYRPEHMRDLYRVCRAKTKIWKDFPNGTHNETILQPKYFDYIEEFITKEVMDPGDNSR